MVQRQVEPEEEEEEEVLQTKEISGHDLEVTLDLESRINVIRGGGQPLPESERAYFEPRFGHDFNQVRVHADTRAAETARAVNARAYTVGQDIVFGAGRYAPGTSAGRRLIGHELVHVVQQQHHYLNKTPFDFRPSRKSPFKSKKRNPKLKQSRDNEIIHNNLIQPMPIAEHITPLVQRGFGVEEKPPASAIVGIHQGWEVDTTCLHFGIRPDKNNQNCYDYWPPHVDEYARKKGYDGVASCNPYKIPKGKHIGGGLNDVHVVRVWYRDRRTAQWSYVKILCADTTANLVELSPHAAKKLFGSLSKAPGATVRVEKSPFGEALCYHYRQPAKRYIFGPTLRDCLSKGCLQKPIAGGVGKRISDEASPWAEIASPNILARGAEKWRKAIKRHRALWVSRIQKRIREQLAPSQRVLERVYLRRLERRIGAFAPPATPLEYGSRHMVEVGEAVRAKEQQALLDKIKGHFAKREFTAAVKLYQKAKRLQDTGVVDTPTSRALGFHSPVPWWVSGEQPTTVTARTARKRIQMWLAEVLNRIKRTVFAWARNISQQQKNRLMKAAGLKGTDPVQWIVVVNLSSRKRRAEVLKLYQAIVLPGSITGKLDRKTCVKLGIPELPHYIFPK